MEFLTLNDFRWDLVGNIVVRNRELSELRKIPDCRRQKPIKPSGLEQKPGDFKNIRVVFVVVGEPCFTENTSSFTRIGSEKEPLITGTGTDDAQVFENGGKSFQVPRIESWACVGLGGDEDDRKESEQRQYFHHSFVLCGTELNWLRLLRCILI